MTTIENMKDIKRLLNKIPDNVLENFIIANGDDGWGLGCTLAPDDDELKMLENYQKFMEKYASLRLLEAYFAKLIEGVADEDGDIIWVKSEAKK